MKTAIMVTYVPLQPQMLSVDSDTREIHKFVAISALSPSMFFEV